MFLQSSFVLRTLEYNGKGRFAPLGLGGKKGRAAETAARV